MNLVNMTLISCDYNSHKFTWDLEVDYKFGPNDEFAFRIVEEHGSYATNKGSVVGFSIIYDLNNEKIKREIEQDLTFTIMALNKEILKKNREINIDNILE